MPSSTPPLGPRPIRIGSLFSGYGGLDLAVEHATGGETAWFSELNDPVARVFTHHWPEAPNLGDITTINWNQVTPLDVLCGGFPCQDVSTVGKQARREATIDAHSASDNPEGRYPSSSGFRRVRSPWPSTIARPPTASATAVCSPFGSPGT